MPQSLKATLFFWRRTARDIRVEYVTAVGVFVGRIILRGETSVVARSVERSVVTR